MTPTFDLLEVLSECSDGMYAIDSEQKLVVWNKRAEEILGWAPGEVLGRYCFDAIAGHSEAQKCSAGCSVIFLANRGIVAPSHSLLAKHKNGQPKWLNIAHVLIPNDSRKLGALVHIFRDSTEEIEAWSSINRLAPQTRNDSKTSTEMTPEDSELQESLSVRETEILRMLARGMSSSQISESLFLSHATVRNHLQHIIAKLGVHSRLEAVITATRTGLI